MEDLHEKYAKKEAEFEEKYADLVNEIAVQNGVDLGVGLDMVKAIARGGNYQGDIEINIDELVADYKELEAISIEIAEQEGNL